MRLGLLICWLVLTGNWAYSQDSQSYQQRLQWSNSHAERTRGGVYRDSIDVNFFGEGERFAWYQVRTGPETREVVVVDTQSKLRELAFDPQELATKLAESYGKATDPKELLLNAIRFSDDAKVMKFRFANDRWEWNRETKSVRKLEQMIEDGDAVEGLQPLPYIPVSGSGDETDIEIVNQTDQTLEVFWVDSSGQRRSYGKVKPGDSFASSTYVTHAWLLVDPAGRNVAAFQADAWEGRAVVTPDTVKPNQSSPRRGRGGRPRAAERSRDNPRNSPDGQWGVFFRDHNVVLLHRESRIEWLLTDDGREGDDFAGRVWWSPDSNHFVVLRTERAEQRQVTMVDSAPDDQLQPKLLTIGYTKPGDKLDHPRPYLFHVPDALPESDREEAASSPLDGSSLAIAVDDKLFPNPYEMNRFGWRSDSSEFLFVYNQRGHQVLRVIGIDAETGKTRAVVDESSETFVCYSQKFVYELFEDTNEILWMTERSGWNHLVLIDCATGKVKNQVTSGDWVVRSVERVDAERRQVWLKVSGYHGDEDPYHVHFARVNFDGSGFTLLTDGDGDHRWKFSPDENWLIDTYSRVDMPPVTSLRNADTGELVCELERADWSELLEKGWAPAERFVAKGRDGVTDIYGIIVRPTNFDPTKKYPVLEDIYAGPHDSFTPKSFSRLRGMYEMADLGFIVVKLDGMGTSNRSKAFHDVCWKNLGDSGFPDRILWMKAAAEVYPELDLDRVGIYGGSAGGQSALRALLAFGDAYHAAAADCGCHDNRMDKIWWNEQWMGWPIGEHYQQQSNVTQAHRLQGKLLLTVGELDTNVDPASTMQVVDALIKSDKDFELIVFPGGGHGIGSNAYGTRRMKDFFVRSLGGPE